MVFEGLWLLYSSISLIFVCASSFLVCIPCIPPSVPCLVVSELSHGLLLFTWWGLCAQSWVCCSFKALIKKLENEGGREGKNLKSCWILKINQPGLNSKQSYKQPFLHSVLSSIAFSKLFLQGKISSSIRLVFLH